MPSKLVNELLDDVNDLRKAFNKHLEESISIKVQLKVNTVLTGIILTVIVGKVFVDAFLK